MITHCIKKLLFIFIVLSFSSAYCQYTNLINSNKPGFSESPYAVGKGVYQFENNLFLLNAPIEDSTNNLQSTGLDFLFRTSFLSEKLEFNSQIRYQRDEINLSNEYTNGLGKFTIGAKYLLFQQTYKDKKKEVRSWKKRNAFDKKRLIPSVALYAGINTDMLSETYKIGQLSPKAGLLFQNNLSNQFTVITNFFYDFIGTDFSEFSYIITGTINLNSRWSTFFENQTTYQNNISESNLGSGFAYLFSKDLQINASARYLFGNNNEGFSAGIGFSYRIDKHNDNFKGKDNNGKALNETPISTYNKKQDRFFNRLFRIFTKDSKKIKRRKKRKRKRNK